MPGRRFPYRLLLSVLICLGQTDTGPGTAWIQGADVPQGGAFRSQCFETFDTAKSLPQAEDLRNWFDVIAGQPQGIFESKTSRGQCAGIEGIVRLKSPWPRDGCLRFMLEDYHRLQLHLFAGDRGVTLVYQEEDQFRWTAYATERESRGVTPSRWALAATDSQRNRRTLPKNHGHYEIRWLTGEIILSRGDVVLLRAPLSGPPSDVYLQGKAVILGFAAIDPCAFPPSEEAGRTGRVLRPADLTWNQQLDEQAIAESLPDGSRRLTVPDRPKKRSWTATVLPRETPGELVLEIDGAGPGAGIYLGNAKDGPRYVLRYVRDRRSKQLCLLVRHDDDVDEHEFRGLTESPLPVVDPHHWIRLVVGAGQVRWWISPDGHHWAEPGEPIRNLPPEVTHFGLHVVSRHAAASITLRSVTIRELSDLRSLVPAELLAQAAPHIAAPNLSTWVSDVTELTPPESDCDAWRRACAIRTLAAGCSRQLGNELLLTLLEDSCTRDLPLVNRLRVLHDAGLLLDLWDDSATTQRFVKQYFDASGSIATVEGSLPFSSVRPALMAAPIATRHVVDLAPDDRLRVEIIMLATQGDWPALKQFCRELRFFQLHAKAPLLEWAENLAIRMSPGVLAESGLNKQKDEWRELLVEELNKDVYNALAQLRVELAGVGRADAARVIAAFDRNLEPGVAPHGRDGQLLVSLPAAVRSILSENPALREILAREHGEVARLRLQQATDQLDAAGIEQITWQFAGTEAADRAHLWLGDAALAAGQFALAADHYRRASGQHALTPLAVISHKLQLASTLAGQDPTYPTTGDVVLGTTTLPAAEFQTWINELAQRRSAESRGHVLGSGADASRLPVPSPSLFQVHKRSRLEGLVGNDPNREFARDTSRRQIDWVDRQLGVTLEKHWMYVCNRFQVAAYDLQARQRIWQTPQPPGQIQFAQESTNIASRPAVVGDRIWARLLFGQGGILTCIDRANGQFVWTAVPAPNESYLSDPFWMRNELWCFQSTRTEQQELIIRLIGLDPHTGNVWRQQEVMRLRDSWHRRRCCEVTVLDDGLVAQFAGVVIRLDVSGRVLWLRKHITVPPDEDPQWITQWIQPPFVAQEKLFVTQPGWHSLDCVQRDNGQVIWSRVLVDLERMVDIVPPHLILQTRTGLQAVSMNDGSTKWSVPLPDLLCGVTGSSAGGVLVAQRLATDSKRERFQPQLLWIDAESGGVTASTVLPGLEETDLRMGPLVCAGPSVWTFWGKGQTDPTRDILELIPSGKPDNRFVAMPPNTWERNVDDRLMSAARQAFPQWRMLHGEPSEPPSNAAEFHGERGMLSVRFRNANPVVFGRVFSFPDQGPSQLRLRIGTEPAQHWKLEVRFRGKPLWSESLTPPSHAEAWKNVTVDLRPVAGQTGWLTVRAWMPQGGDALLHVKALDLVF